jgi:hypothetical protein
MGGFGVAIVNLTGAGISAALFAGIAWLVKWYQANGEGDGDGDADVSEDDSNDGDDK